MAMLPAQAPSEQGPVTQMRPRFAGGPFRGLASRSDERLVSLAKEGDERAFEVLYERHAPAILRYCRSLLRSTQEAEDVKQETFVLAISALRRGAEPDAFRPWLYRVAHNACMSHLRVRRPVLVADNGVLVGPATAAAPVDDHREELRQLLDDIGKLPDVQRGALLLREMDGFSYEQVGEVLGLPLSTVRASIFRARRTLQGLAEARDADCEVIQSELSRLADRRGRRARHITTHLNVCSSCRDFRDGLRRRPAILGGVTPVAPFGPGGLLVVLKGKLLGGTAASGSAGAAIATTGGGASVAKIAAVAASSIALLAGAGIEADHVIEGGRPDAAAAPHRSSAAELSQAASGRSALATGVVGATAPATTAAAADVALRGGRLGEDRRAPARVSTRARTHARMRSTTGSPSAATHTPSPPLVIPTATVRSHESGTPSTGEGDHASRSDDTSAAHHGERHQRQTDDDERDPSGPSDDGGSSGHGGGQRVEEPSAQPSSGAGSGSGSGSSGSSSGGGSHDDTSSSGPGAPVTTAPAPAPTAPAPAPPVNGSSPPASQPPAATSPPVPPGEPDVTAVPAADPVPAATTAADASASAAGAATSQP
jgi:RNA polymerase sigma factor (sigma-70 family)